MKESKNLKKKNETDTIKAQKTFQDDQDKTS